MYIIVYIYTPAIQVPAKKTTMARCLQETAIIPIGNDLSIDLLMGFPRLGRLKAGHCQSICRPRGWYHFQPIAIFAYICYILDPSFHMTWHRSCCSHPLYCSYSQKTVVLMMPCSIVFFHNPKVRLSRWVNPLTGRSTYFCWPSPSGQNALDLQSFRWQNLSGNT